MAGENNTTDTTVPATTAAEAPTTPAPVAAPTASPDIVSDAAALRALSGTQVAIIDPRTGRPFDIRNIDAAGAALIYERLPEQYRLEADRITRAIAGFAGVESLGIPATMDLQQACRDTINNLIANGGRLGADAPPWMRILEAQAGEMLRRTPEYLRNAPVVREVADTTDMTSGIVEGVFAPITIPFNTVVGLLGEADEQLERLGGGIPPEKAAAYAICYAAVDHRVAAQRGAPAVERAPGTERPNFFDNAWSWFQWLGSMLVHNTGGFGEWLMGLLNGGEERGREILAQERQNGVPTREEFAQRNADERVGRERGDQTQNNLQEVGGIMRSAGAIAGYPTEGLTRLLTEGGIMRDQDGTYAIVRFQNGQLQRRPIVGDNGQPITPGDRRAERWENWLGHYGTMDQNSDPTNHGLLLGGAAGIALATRYYPPAWRFVSTTTTGLAAGAVHSVQGFSGGVVQQAAYIANPSSAQAARYLALMDPRTGRIAELTAKVNEGGLFRFYHQWQLNAATAEAARLAPGGVAPVANVGARGLQFADETARGAGEVAAAAAGTGRVAQFFTGFGQLMGRASPWIGGAVTVWDGYSLYTGVRDQDSRQITGSGTRLTTVAVATGTGFLMGGPPGALIGFCVGGVASIFSGWGAEAIHDQVNPGYEAEMLRRQREQAATGSGDIRVSNDVMTDPGLQRAIIAVAQQRADAGDPSMMRQLDAAVQQQDLAVIQELAQRPDVQQARLAFQQASASIGATINADGGGTVPYARQDGGPQFRVLTM